LIQWTLTLCWLTQCQWIRWTLYTIYRMHQPLAASSKSALGQSKMASATSQARSVLARRHNWIIVSSMDIGSQSRQWYNRWAAVPVFVLFPWLCQYRMQCWIYYKHYSIGTAGTNGYLWECKYHWTTFGHDHRNSLFEGLIIDLTQPFISHWIRPVRGPILMILLYDLSSYPPYPEIPWLSVDLTRARGICYLECEHPKIHALQNMLCDH